MAHLGKFRNMEYVVKDCIGLNFIMLLLTFVYSVYQVLSNRKEHKKIKIFEKTHKYIVYQIQVRLNLH